MPLRAVSRWWNESYARFVKSLLALHSARKMSKNVSNQSRNIAFSSMKITLGICKRAKGHFEPPFSPAWTTLVVRLRRRARVV